MPATVLHIGIEHPDTLWILVTSLLSFLTGLGFRIHSGRLRDWLRPGNAKATT